MGSGVVSTGQAYFVIGGRRMTPPASYLTIPLTQGQVAIVDESDYAWLSQWKWHAHWNPCTKSFYAQRKGVKISGKQPIIWMHKQVLGIGKGTKGDHRNRITLDNRRHNLRAATSSQNCMNRSLRRDNTSGFPGVSWHPPMEKWKVYAQVDGKQKTIGYRKDFLDAVALRKSVIEVVYGEFAVTSFPYTEERLQ